MDLIRTLMNVTGIRPVAGADPASPASTGAAGTQARTSIPLPGVVLPAGFPATQTATIQTVNTQARQMTLATPQGPVTLPLPPGFPATPGQTVQVAINASAQTLTIQITAGQQAPAAAAPASPAPGKPAAKPAPDKSWAFTPTAVTLFRPYDRPDQGAHKPPSQPGGQQQTPAATPLDADTATGLVIKLTPLPLPALARLVLTPAIPAMPPQPHTATQTGAAALLPLPPAAADTQAAIPLLVSSPHQQTRPGVVALANPLSPPLPPGLSLATSATKPDILPVILPSSAASDVISAGIMPVGGIRPQITVTPPAMAVPLPVPHDTLVTITALHAQPLVLTTQTGLPAATLLPPQGDTQAGWAQAIVIAHDTAGRPVLQPLPPLTGALAVGAPTLIGSPLPAPLPEGAIVTYIPMQAQTAGASPAPHVPGVLPLGAWDDMTALLQSMPAGLLAHDGMPHSPAHMTAVPPLMLPGIHPDPRLMAPLAALVLGAIAGGDPLALIRPHSLDAARRAQLDTALEKALGDPALKPYPSQDAAHAEWKSHIIPYVHDGQAHRMALHVRDHHAGGGDNPDADRPVRFVFDLSLDRMGDVQLDGLYRKHKATASLDLTLRTELSLSPAMKTRIGDVYRAVLEGAGMTGEVIFQGARDHFAVIKPYDSAAVQGWIV